MKKNADFLLVIILIWNIILLGCVFGVCLTSLNASFVDKNVHPILYFVLFVIILIIVCLVRFLKYLLKNRKKDVNKAILKEEKISSEFEELYQKLYDKHLHELELMRDDVKLRTIVQWIFAIIFIIGYAYMDLESIVISQTIDTIITVVTIISGIVAAYFVRANYKYKKNYSKTYKTNIVSKFIKLVNEDLKYIPYNEDNSGIEKEYRNAEFDDRQFNKFDLDDCIEGNIEDVLIQMSDVHVQHVTSIGNNKKTEEIFQGIFTITNFNSDIKSSVRIVNNRIAINTSKQKVNMDSEKFEQYFDVYAEDKIMAMRILTSDIMELLVEFINKYGIEFEIVIKNNNIYIRFHTGPMFEPKTFGSSMEKELLFIYFNILKFGLEITKKINHVLKSIEI